MSDPASHGRDSCILDALENAPFASIGGLSARDNPQCPAWVATGDWGEFLRGYIAQAVAMYGEDWRTAQFGWRPALTISPEDSHG